MTYKLNIDKQIRENFTILFQKRLLVHSKNRKNFYGNVDYFHNIVTKSITYSYIDRVQLDAFDRDKFNV